MQEFATYTEEQLIQLARRGNQLAFGQLVVRYEEQVRTTVLGILDDTAEADDVAQEVFIRFYRSLENFRGESQLGTYLTRIAINLSYDVLRRRKRMPKTSLHSSETPWQIEDPGSDPERKELQDLVWQAVNQLEAELRPAVTLHFIQGYTVQETAALLKQPEGTVAGRLAKAMQLLRNFLTPLLR